MRQAGVRATRRDILEYSMNMGYHHRLSNEDDLILALAPEYDAVVTRDGVYPIVQKNIDSGDEIILDELRYLGPFVEAERWLETVRKTGRRFRIKVRLNPGDPSSIWYQDPDTGLHRLDLATKDPLIRRLATIQDLTLRKTEDAISLNDVANEALEERARIQLQNNAERKAIAQRKAEAILASTGKKGNSSKASGRRAAMQKGSCRSRSVAGTNPIANVRNCANHGRLRRFAENSKQRNSAADVPLASWMMRSTDGLTEIRYEPRSFSQCLQNDQGESANPLLEGISIAIMRWKMLRLIARNPFLDKRWLSQNRDIDLFRAYLSGVVIPTGSMLTL